MTAKTRQKQIEPPLIGELTPEEFRQKLAGLLDPREQISPERREEIKQLAIDFSAALPSVFGDALDRKTMWDRIGTALEVAFAKTAGGDHEFFIEQVMQVILAKRSAASSNQAIARVMATLNEWTSEDRQAWITYFSTHLVPILVHARNAWVTRPKKTAKKKEESDK